MESNTGGDTASYFFGVDLGVSSSSLELSELEEAGFETVFLTGAFFGATFLTGASSSELDSSEHDCFFTGPFGPELFLSVSAQLSNLTNLSSTLSFRILSVPSSLLLVSLELHPLNQTTRN